MNTPLIITAAALTLPATLHAQSLFHAPLPPQPQQQADQPPAQPQPQQPPAALQPLPTPAASATDKTAAASTNQPAPAAPAPQTPALEQSAAVTQVVARSMMPPVDQISLFAVKPLKPHRFNKQDKVQIIVNESSLAKFEQTADNKESSDISAALKDLPNIMRALTEGTIQNTGPVTPKVGFTNGSKYKGEGSYERTDKFTAKISAIVTDVKPNGMLVLEARETIMSDKESKMMVVSGLCDPRDIKNDNTVVSNQLANLVIKTEHAGDVKDAATKGWLPKIFDTITGNNP